MAQHQTIAVTGTSGKSTVTAMIWTILRGFGKDPGLLTGGPATALQDQGLLGNACSGSEPGFLVVEADESDGSVVRYHPWAGVVLNLGRDHKEPAEIAEMFTTFRLNCSGPLIIGDGATSTSCAPGRRHLRPRRPGPGARHRPGAGPPRRGLHRGQRALHRAPARRASPRSMLWPPLRPAAKPGCAPVDMAEPLAGFRGVARRFVSVGTARGVEVIDDFAHNPDKLAAALAAGRDRLAGTAGRVLAVFQPHGFGPTRFLRDDLVASLAASLRPEDVLWLPEIFYAGGTVTRDISSADLVAGDRRRRAATPGSRRRPGRPAGRPGGRRGAARGPGPGHGRA